MKGKTVLLVEDEAIIALVQKDILEKQGAEVVLVHTGEAAVKVIDASADIDLILMDVNLGKGMDGTQAATKILEKHDIPLIFLSSHSGREVVDKTEGITSYGYVVKNSGETVLIASINMAFRLFEAKMIEQQQKRLLEESEATARALLDAQLDTVIVLDAMGTILHCNATVAQRASVSPSELIGKCAWDLLPPEDTDRRRAYLEEVIQTRRMGRFEDLRGDRWFDNVIYPILDARQEVTRVAIVAKDVTESRRAEERLRESRNLFRAITENAADSIFIKDRDGTYSFVNEAMTELLGLQKEEIIGMTPVEIYGAETGSVLENVDRRTFTGETVEFVETVPIRGEAMTLHTVQTPLSREDGKVMSIMGIRRDITKLKHAETRLETALQEKKELLLEFQHRAANSFTLISSMMALSASASASKDVKKTLSNLRSRVSAIAEMYSMLHLSDSVISVDLDGYIARIVASLNGVAGSTSLRSSLDAITVSARKAMPLGLITVELITNAVKHAFPEGAGGTVEIILKQTDSIGRLEVWDTGVGLPDSFDPLSATSLGTVLVNALVNQIGGSVAFESREGTRCLVDFPIEDA